MGDRLRDRIVVVTGAGSGIGRASALRFAAEGAVVVVNDRVADSAEATVAEILRRGGQAEADAGDVTSSDYVDRLVGGTVARHGRLDVMHNNAGGALPRPLLEVSDEEYLSVVAVNQHGVFYGVRAALRVMVPQGKGAIVSTTSGAGLAAVPGLSAYGMAKAAIIMLTRNAAIEYASTGVRINAVSPGSMSSPGLLGWLATVPIGQAGYEAQIPQGRLGLPEEIADAVVWLASDESSYVNGTVIPVDGGVWAKLASPSTDGPDSPGG